MNKETMNNELVSIIITNYNYERYLAASIASALAVDWSHTEIIVVDDGSTDRSRDIVDSFAPMGIKSLYIENQGQARAAARGFTESRGEWIVFLDADDILEPSIIREAVKVMRPGWSMVQFRMRVIDGLGNPAGRFFPTYRGDTTPEKIRSWAAVAASYPAAPTSGNVLARSFLDRIFPLEDGMDSAIDTYFTPTAPFLGDVLTVDKPLVNYRVHANNSSAQSTLDVTKIAHDLRRHIAGSRYSARIASANGIEIAPNRWRYAFYNMGMRLASLRLAPAQHPIQNDTRTDCVRDTFRSLTKWQGLSPLRHASMLIWLLSVALAPVSVARMLVAWRYTLKSRPQAVQRLIDATKPKANDQWKSNFQ
jgi:glycosyltransferase involved in cell wall biosynthesis